MVPNSFSPWGVEAMVETESEPSARRSSRPLWFLIVAVFEVMAIAGPVKMVVRGDSSSKYGSTSGGSAVVKMAGLRFSPKDLVVPRGTSVLFDNDDLAPHTVTAKDDSIDSGTLRPGASFTLTVNERLEYFCAIHPSMTATIEIAG